MLEAPQEIERRVSPRLAHAREASECVANGLAVDVNVAIYVFEHTSKYFIYEQNAVHRSTKAGAVGERTRAVWRSRMGGKEKKNTPRKTAMITKVQGQKRGEVLSRESSWLVAVSREGEQEEETVAVTLPVKCRNPQILCVLRSHWLPIAYSAPHPCRRM